MKLSNNEKRLYDLIVRDRRLQRGGRITTDELAKKYFGADMPDREAEPYRYTMARITMSGLIRRLKNKSELVPGLRKIESTEGSGRKSVEVWLTPARESAS